MGAPTAGEVGVIPFPFSDLTQSKVRPALCLADAGRGDYVLCQITSQPASRMVIRRRSNWTIRTSQPAVCMSRVLCVRASYLLPTPT